MNLLPSAYIYGTLPNYDLLWVFIYAYFVLFQPYEWTKVEQRARLCCLIGYGVEHKRYWWWDPISKRLQISCHVVFWERESCYFTDVVVSLFLDTDETLIEVPCSTLDETPFPFDTSVSDPSTPSSNIAASKFKQWHWHIISIYYKSVLPRSSRVSQQPTYLQNYRCYSLVSINHEPYTFK